MAIESDRKQSDFVSVCVVDEMLIRSVLCEQQQKFYCSKEWTNISEYFTSRPQLKHVNSLCSGREKVWPRDTQSPAKHTVRSSFHTFHNQCCLHRFLAAEQFNQYESPVWQQNKSYLPELRISKFKNNAMR